MASYFPSELLVIVLDLLAVEVVYSTLWLAEWTFGLHQPFHSRVEQSAIEGEVIRDFLLICYYLHKERSLPCSSSFVSLFVGHSM